MHYATNKERDYEVEGAGLGSWEEEGGAGLGGCEEDSLETKLRVGTLLPVKAHQAN